MKPSDIGILIVDDEASVRDALHKWFEFDGYRVDSAADATIALQKLQDASWDIVLLDIKMPGMDGLELQRRIKEIDKDIITIMITAFASVDTSIQALKEGAFDYVVKPVDPDDMSHLIRNAVEQRRLYYENRQLRSHIEELNLTDDIVRRSAHYRDWWSYRPLNSSTGTSGLQHRPGDVRRAGSGLDGVGEQRCCGGRAAPPSGGVRRWSLRGLPHTSRAAVTGQHRRQPRPGPCPFTAGLRTG